MRISIIIPTYNSEKTIRRCIDSIVRQTYRDWEVLVMDGASTDSTVAIVKLYDDARIHIYSEPDNGIYDAMNKGIRRAEGEWLYFLGSDDCLHDAKVLSDIAKELEGGYGVVYGEVDAPQLSSKHKGEWKIENLDYNRCHQAILYHNSVFKRLGGYDTRYSIYADHDLNIKWFFDGHIKAKYVNRVIADYADGGVSSDGRDQNFVRDHEWNVLRRGWCKLPKKNRSYYIREASEIALLYKMKNRYRLLQFLKYANKWP